MCSCPPVRPGATRILTYDLDTPVRLVPLTALSERAAIEQAVRLLVARRNATDPLREPTSRMAAQNEVLEVLGWIWDTITEPVLTALGHIATPGDKGSWPRVWWCPVGILAYLPLACCGASQRPKCDRPCQCGESPYRAGSCGLLLHHYRSPPRLRPHPRKPRQRRGRHSRCARCSRHFTAAVRHRRSHDPHRALAGRSGSRRSNRATPF